MKHERWREIAGWKGGYDSDPDGVCYMDKELNGFKLRISNVPAMAINGQLTGDINAKGCCEKVECSSDGKCARYYVYQKVKDGSFTGYNSGRKEIDGDIKTPEDLALYLEEYAGTHSVDEWVKECKDQDWFKD